MAAAVAMFAGAAGVVFSFIYGINNNYRDRLIRHFRIVPPPVSSVNRYFQELPPRHHTCICQQSIKNRSTTSRAGEIEGAERSKSAFIRLWDEWYLFRHHKFPKW